MSGSKCISQNVGLLRRQVDFCPELDSRMEVQLQVIFIWCPCFFSIPLIPNATIDMCLQFSENKSANLCFKLGHGGRYSFNDSVTNREQLGKTSKTKQKSEALVGRKITHMFLCLGKIPDLWLRIDMERKLPSVRRSQLIWNNCHPRFYTETLNIRSLYIIIVFDLNWIKKLSKFLNHLFLCFFYYMILLHRITFRFYALLL